MKIISSFVHSLLVCKLTSSQPSYRAMTTDWHIEINQLMNTLYFMVLNVRHNCNQH